MRKKKLLVSILGSAIVLTLLFSLTGCGKNPYGTTEVLSTKDTTIGNVKKEGLEINIPKDAFKQNVKVTVEKIANNEASYMNGKDTFLTEPFEVNVEGMEAVRLNKPVKISMKLDKKNLPDNNTFDQYVMSYWTGDNWEFITPDVEELQKGYLTFETWHFSSYSGKKMTDEEQVKEYARYMAMDDLTMFEVNPTLKEKITAVVDDYLNGLSIYDQEARDEIYKRVINSTGIDSIVFLTEHGESTAELGHKITELVVQSTVDVCAENPLVLETVSTALGTVGDVAEASLALIDGDYHKATSELTALGATVLGYGGVGAVKSLVELGAAAVEQGIMGWKEYELECAYKAYYGLAKKTMYGYKINTGDWDGLMIQMGGYYNQIVRERKDAYKSISGKDTLTDEEEAMIERQVESDLKKKFEERAKIDSKIDAKQAEYEKPIKAFKNVGLFTRTENGFNKDMTIQQRLHSLFRIRKIILDMVDGDISKFGNEKNREENLAWAIKMWLGYGTDRAKFYNWMREQRYLEELKEGIGYWKLVQSFENPENKVSPYDEYRSYSLSGGNGSYHSKVTTLWSNYSNYHDGNCVGEYVEVTATSSQPKSKYAGGEKVTLDLAITPQVSSQICAHYNATIGAAITPVNHDRPFVSYGTNQDMYDIKEEHTKSYLWIAGDGHANYFDMKVTVGGIMPSGSENGNKVYIIINYHGGLAGDVTTAYEYEWVTKK